jgi:hypothetical protein
MQLAHATEEEGRRRRGGGRRRREVRVASESWPRAISGRLILHPNVFFVNFVM